MLIVTHPDNIELVRRQVTKEREAESGFIHTIKPFGIEFIANNMLEKEQWTGRYLVEGNDFFTYWDGEGKPPDWALYFGFVKRIMEPIFYIINQPTVFSPEWGRKNR